MYRYMLMLNDYLKGSRHSLELFLLIEHVLCQFWAMKGDVGGTGQNITPQHAC